LPTVRRESDGRKQEEEEQEEGRGGGLPDAYARAGVDVGKVRSMQSTMARLFESTFSTRRGRFGRPKIPIGHYAGLIDIGDGRLLGMHTDNVGTKVLVAQQLAKFDTVGIDCVAMTVNDLICLGCEPVALLDHMSLEREDAELVGQLSLGLADGARQAGAAIVGGETAIVGELVKGIGGRGFDLISMGVGVVGEAEVIDGSAIRDGDAVVGVESSGLHSNGYTLARRIVEGKDLTEHRDELGGESIGDALLRPTNVYVRPTLDAIKRHEVHGVAHITGGAFAKLTRLTGKRGRMRRLRFDLNELKGGGGRQKDNGPVPSIPPIFSFLQREGGLTDEEMYRTFNMGVGLCLVCPREEVEGVIREYRRGKRGGGFRARQIGMIVKGDQGVSIGEMRIA
jgi:phosphoribosylformylglycinamidine cyclo-ligase